MQESGVASYVVDAWIGLNAPAGKPLDVMRKLNAALLDSLRDPAVVKAMHDAGLAPAGTTAEVYGANS